MSQKVRQTLYLEPETKGLLKDIQYLRQKMRGPAQNVTMGEVLEQAIRREAELIKDEHANWEKSNVEA